MFFKSKSRKWQTEKIDVILEPDEGLGGGGGGVGGVELKHLSQGNIGKKLWKEKSKGED